MPVTETEKEDLRRKIDIVSLIRSYGLDLRQAGKEYKALCPFQAEKTPSFQVNPEKGVYKCFGCGKRGDIFTFVMEMEGIGFLETYRKLAGQNGNILKDNSTKAKVSRINNSRVKIPGSDIFMDMENQRLLHMYTEHCRRTLKERPSVQEYLISRGVTHPEVLEHFRIGYADGSFIPKLPPRNTGEGREMWKRLKELGIITENGREFLAGCIIFPVCDEKSLILQIAARRVKARDNASNHLFLPHPKRGLLNIDCLKADAIILTEGPFDMLSFWQNGFRNVTCVLGNGFDRGQIPMIHEHGINKIFLALDADAGGATLIRDLSGKFAAYGIECYRLSFPEGMDPNEYALSETDARASLAKLLEKAKKVEPGEKRDIPEKISDEPDICIEEDGPILYLSIGDRKYRVDSFQKNTAHGSLSVTLEVKCGDEFHPEIIELYDPGKRDKFIRRAAAECGISEEILAGDMKRLLSTLRARQDTMIRKKLEPEKKSEISPDRIRRAVEEIGMAPHPWKRMVLDSERCGTGGERLNLALGHFVMLSRLTEYPLSLIIQARSSAGKSNLMDALLSFVPDEERHEYSFMTGKSLYYIQSKNLKYKVLAISEEEGLESAKYPLKLLQSEGKISVISTMRNAETGQLETEEFKVEGPVVIIVTTTNVEIDEELKNRSLIVTINEEDEQTLIIQDIQRRGLTLEGLLEEGDRASISGLQQDFQRSLRRLKVVVPFAEEVVFPYLHLRDRRDYKKFLSLFRTIVLSYQHRREINRKADKNGNTVEYIIALREDWYLAKFLMLYTYGTSVDDMAPQTKKLLKLLIRMRENTSGKTGTEKKNFRCTKKDIREYTKWSDTALRKQLEMLVALEYLKSYGGGHGNLVTYAILYDGKLENGERYIPELSVGDSQEERRYMAELLKFFK